PADCKTCEEVKKRIDELRSEIDSLEKTQIPNAKSSTSPNAKEVLKGLEQGLREDKEELKRLENQLATCGETGYCPRGKLPWTGTSGGFQLTGSWSRVKTNEFDAFTLIQTNGFADSGSGTGAGINFGYDWQIANNAVVGVVFDADMVSDKVAHTFANGTFIA